MTGLHTRLVDDICSAGADTGVDECEFDRKYGGNGLTYAR